MANKISLPNGCSCSKLSVFPRDWNSTPKSVKARTALIEAEWYISYRFYDPTRQKPKQKILKGMNDYKTLEEKQNATKTLIANELDLLQNHAYNPFADTKDPASIDEPESFGDINPQMAFLKALTEASKAARVGKYAKRDLKDVISGLKPVADRLGLSDLPVSSIRRKHIRLILNKLGASPHKFNKYRSYLIILFKELIEAEATDQDPVSLIKKSKTTKKMRLTLTKKERKIVSDHLFKAHYRFWRFMHIFFHSGSRESEMMLLRYEDVDLGRQSFKVIVLKDGVAREEWRTIKDIILPLWIEIMAQAKLGQYLFAKFLRPGGTPIEPVQISRYWARYVKAPAPKGLDIEADFYSLKHSNLDEIADLLSVKDASTAAGHTNTTTTKKHYLPNEKTRQHNRLKRIDNPLADDDSDLMIDIPASGVLLITGDPCMN